MKKLFSFLRVTYLWTQPVAFAVLLLLFKISNVQGVETLFALLILSFLPCAVINISASRQPSSKLSQEERQREQSQQKIPAEMRKTQPEAGDLILGRFKRDYICTSLEHTDSHYAIIGTSGTGKTSCYLLNNLILNHDTGALVLDVRTMSYIERPPGAATPLCCALHQKIRTPTAMTRFTRWRTTRPTLIFCR